MSEPQHEWSARRATPDDAGVIAVLFLACSRSIRPSVKTLYHGTSVAGIEELEPRRRFTPGALGMDAPPAIYATDDPAYAAAQAFPWSSAEGFDLRYVEGVVVLTVPGEHAPRLEQPICVYELPATSFELLPQVAPRGRNYRSLRAVRPISVQAFPTVRAGIERYGGQVRLAAETDRRSVPV
jgi:hypothetical protein